MTPIVYIYNVNYADDIQSTAAMFENLIAQGATDIHAVKINNMYRIESYIPREEKENVDKN